MDEGESRNLNKETFVPKITEITVSAGRTFNHPHESFSNLKPHVALKVEVLPREEARRDREGRSRGGAEGAACWKR